MIEIVDRMLQLLEHVLLALAVARHVGDGPHRRARLAPAVAEPPHPQAQPARRLPAQAGHAHFLLQAAPLARRLGEPVYRLRHVRVADEHPLHRAHVVRVHRIDQMQVGGIGVHHPGLIGHHQPVIGSVGDRLDQRVDFLAARHAQDAGRDGEQREHADHRQDGKQPENVRLGAAAAEKQECQRRAHQGDGHQQHHADRAAAPAALHRHSGGLAYILGRHGGLCRGSDLRRKDPSRRRRNDSGALCVSAPMPASAQEAASHYHPLRCRSRIT
jgi:hypothetical protein